MSTPLLFRFRVVLLAKADIELQASTGRCYTP